MKASRSDFVCEGAACEVDVYGRKSKHVRNLGTVGRLPNPCICGAVQAGEDAVTPLVDMHAHSSLTCQVADTVPGNSLHMV